MIPERQPVSSMSKMGCGGASGIIPQRLHALRTEMKKRGIDIYLVPTADFHESEYVGEHFKERAYITGFTGSAGTAVITLSEAGMWTDGRYFVQAAEQLKDTTVTLYREGEEGVPTVLEYLEEKLSEGGCLGFDGRCVNGKLGRKLQELVCKKKGSLQVDEDLIDFIWRDRPPLSKETAWVLDLKYSGQSMEDKLASVRRSMRQQGADVHLVSSLCDIAWLLNLRGNDISYVPVVLSYLALTGEDCFLFVQKETLDEETLRYLRDNHVEVRPYEAFYDYAASLRNSRILLDSTIVNYRVLSSITDSNQLVDTMNPEELFRSVKNPVELANIRIAHEKDAVAMCRFMYWLKKNAKGGKLTELSAAEHLRDLRMQQEGFLDLSFETICAYGEHGAIVHYAATEETNVALKPEGFLLVDSGGHYPEGTTDITRTFALGPLTEQMKADYTRVLRSNLALMNAKFLYGCTGRNLDILAREPLWEAGLDYKHGTGHGVGYILNVHEGPNAFRWKQTADEAVLEEGMVTTDEPGLYLEGQYGIRLENELVCRCGSKNEYGQFMYFENLTYVPFDLDAVDAAGLSDRERTWLNQYHKEVYATVSPYMDGEELDWLRAATREID